MEMATFWNQKHPLAAKADELFALMVPFQGNCLTLEGELLRASNKIGYDWYNNGWGCNNWSGAVCFIKEHISVLPLSAEQLASINHELNHVHEYSHGEPCSANYGGRNCKAVTTIHEIIVQGILDTPVEAYHANTHDMYNYQEEDYVPDEEGYDWNSESDDE